MKRWRKIKTAPQNGIPILAHNGAGYVTTIWWNGSRWVLCYGGQPLVVGFDPVEWMELEEVVRRKMR